MRNGPVQTNVPVNGRFLECGYTSFEVSGTIPRLMKDEHDKTMAEAFGVHAAREWKTGKCLPG